MNYFLARFTTVTSTEKFKADKNGRLPLIGEVLAGISKGSIFNGTQFLNGKYEEGKTIYVCENYESTDPETGEVYINTRILQAINGFKELADARAELGPARTVRSNEEATPAPVVAVVEDDIVVEAEENVVV